MKKTYKKPLLVVADIETESLMLITSGEPDVTVDPTKQYGEMQSKKSVLDWDE